MEEKNSENQESKAWGEGLESRVEELVADVAQRVEKEAEADKVVIHGDPERIASETAEVSPERRPGDPKAGPNALRLEMLAGVFIVLCFAVAMGWWVNALAGVLTGLIGILSLSLNPVFGAAAERAIDREAIAVHHQVRNPDMVVLPVHSKRKERRQERTM